MNKNLSEQYVSKIKSISDLKVIIGEYPRKQTVIMCHGVFDLVHPGHIRHLQFAKSRGKILVASLTCDKHITKGLYRPHVPENIRAKTLAAFEMVDYVIIDKNKTPMENIKFLKPDFFAKGFEYSNTERNIATEEEAKVVEGYGGKMILPLEI